MRIDHIQVHTLLHRYAPGEGFRYAGGTATGRLTSLVAVHTDDGHTGWGSVYSHPGLVRLVIEHQIAPILIGQPVEPVEQHWERLYALTRWYGRKGAALSALGGVDMALWDLRGKAAGKPVHALLGAQRTHVPAYASALLWQDDLGRLEAEAARHVANGFRRMKMRLGRGPDYDLPALEAVQKGAGPGVDVMVDGSQAYTLPQARALAGELAKRKAFWFEEPFTPEALDDYAALRADSPVFLAAGENEFGVQGFQELMRTRAVDIVQPDTCRAGGITECRRVFELAGPAGLRVAPHTWSDAIALLANAHLVAAHPHGLTVEVDQTGNPFIERLLGRPLTVRDGLLELPSTPGLGADPDPAVLAELTLPADEALPDGSYSDMMFGRAHLPPSWRDA